MWAEQPAWSDYHAIRRPRNRPPHGDLQREAHAICARVHHPQFGLFCGARVAFGRSTEAIRGGVHLQGYHLSLIHLWFMCEDREMGERDSLHTLPTHAPKLRKDVREIIAFLVVITPKVECNKDLQT